MKIIIVSLSLTIFSLLLSQGVYSLNPNQLPPSLQANIVSYFEMNGNAQDSISDNHGTLIGGVTCNDQGYFGIASESGCLFDQDGEYIEGANPNGLPQDIPGDFTITAWIYANSDNNQRWAVSFNTNSGQRVLLFGKRSNSDTLCFLDSGLGMIYIDTTQIIEDGKWHMIAFTRDSINSETRLYLDASNIYECVFSVNGCSSGLGIQPTDFFSLGMRYTGGPTPTEYWRGYADDVVVWDRELSDSEIQNLYDFYLCFDGIQNLGETGVDCGGTVCSACSVSGSAVGAPGMDMNVIALLLGILVATCFSVLSGFSRFSVIAGSH